MMWETADRFRFMSKRELAREVETLIALVTEQKAFINDLKADLQEARESR